MHRRIAIILAAVCMLGACGGGGGGRKGTANRSGSTDGQIVLHKQSLTLKMTGAFALDSSSKDLPVGGASCTFFDSSNFKASVVGKIAFPGTGEWQLSAERYTGTGRTNVSLGGTPADTGFHETFLHRPDLGDTGTVNTDASRGRIDFDDVTLFLRSDITLAPAASKTVVVNGWIVCPPATFGS